VDDGVVVGREHGQERSFGMGTCLAGVTTHLCWCAATGHTVDTTDSATGIVRPSVARVIVKCSNATRTGLRMTSGKDAFRVRVLARSLDVACHVGGPVRSQDRASFRAGRATPGVAQPADAGIVCEKHAVAGQPLHITDHSKACGQTG
jgi:hypothetical protein